MDNPKVIEPEPQPVYFCCTCGGPLFHGDPISWAVGAEGECYVSHRFKTTCNHYFKKDKDFLHECGIEPIVDIK